MTKKVNPINERGYFSEERLVKFRNIYPELTWSVYCKLNDYGISDTKIKWIYRIGNDPFNYFKKGHVSVFGAAGKWID